MRVAALVRLLAFLVGFAVSALFVLMLLSGHPHGNFHASSAGFRTKDNRLIYFVTADNRLPSVVPKLFTNMTPHNLALEGETYRGGTMWKIWKMWLFLPAAVHAKADVVVFCDGDMLFGGCALQELADAYDSYVAATGARIVASAEAECYAPGPKVKRVARCQQYDRAPFVQRARGALRFNVTREHSHLLRRHKCFAQQEGAESGRYCGQYAYLNSGGYMGPPRELQRMVRWMLWHAIAQLPVDLWRWAVARPKYFLTPNDQTTMAEYMHSFPERVTLDYGARIWLSAWGLDLPSMLSISPSGVQWHGTVPRRHLCWMHANGGGSDAMKRRYGRTRRAGRRDEGSLGGSDAKAPPAKPPMGVVAWLGMEAAEGLLLFVVVGGEALLLMVLGLVLAHALSPLGDAQNYDG